MSEFRTIPLSQGQVAIVDASDFERINRWKWHAMWVPKGRCFYAVRRPSKWTGTRPTILMHREILEAGKGVVVDHREHDTLDNRRENLRTATVTQNSFNARKSRRNTSGFKGVSWEPRRKRWYSQIRANSKNNFLGYFDTPEEAHAAYMEAATKHAGEFACAG